VAWLALWGLGGNREKYTFWWYGVVKNNYFWVNRAMSGLQGFP